MKRIKCTTARSNTISKINISFEGPDQIAYAKNRLVRVGSFVLPLKISCMAVMMCTMPEYKPLRRLEVLQWVSTSLASDFGLARVN